MFIVQKFVNDFKKKEENYQDRMKKWVAGSDYRYESEFRRKYGASPKEKLATRSKYVIVTVLSAIVLFCGIMWVDVEATQPDQSQNNTTETGQKE